MARLKRLVAALLGAMVVAAGSAAAEDCAGARTEALGVSVRPVTTGAELQAAFTDMDALVDRCPEDAWLNALGAAMDFRVYSTIMNANNNQMNQQSFDVLNRAFYRSNRYGEAPAEARPEVAGVQTPHGRAGLSHDAARGVRREIMTVFLAMARAGHMHPYLKVEEPLTCHVWLRTDVQTIGYQVQSRTDLGLMPFIDAAAETCRDNQEGWLRTPLAVAAQAHLRLVQKGAITDPAAVGEALLKARDYRDAYLATEGFDAFYSKFDAGQLDGELRKHGVDPMAGRLARELWFRPEHLGSEIMQFSVAYALSEAWAELAAKMQTEGLGYTAADAAYTRFANEVLAEGRAAGQEEQTKAALRNALTDVQTNRVRAPAIAGHEPPRAVIYTALMNAFAAAPAPVGGN
ncbi:hypothetical protein [Hyphomonas sp.]|uniref:hypothetical protein n=1 Tax=Hyphomonas sp. TaxID=87 RepID=UPI00391CB78A